MLWSILSEKLPHREEIKGPSTVKGPASAGCIADSICVCVCMHGTAQTRLQWQDSEQSTLNMHEVGGWCHVSLSICDVHAIGQWVNLPG